MPHVTADYLEGRRTEILAAAHRCFARHGFRETTMQQIASEAELSVGALYRYFEGKEALIEALAEGGRSRRKEAVEAAEAGSGVAGLTELVAKLMAQLPGPGAGEDVIRFDVRMWGEALGQPPLQRLVADVLRGLRQPVTDYVRREQKAGRIRKDAEPEAIAGAVVSLLAGLELQLAFDPRLDRAAYADGVTRLLGSLEPQRRSAAKPGR